MKNRKHILSGLLLLICTSMFGQTEIGKEITKSVSDNTTPPATLKEYIGRDRIYFKPGYTFSAQPDNTMKARIDESQLFDADDESFTDLSSRVLDFSKQIGYIPGSFSVGNSGDANYSIPIPLPIGTNGMTPQLLIGYNSNTGDGNMGFGFNLSSGSAITLVPKNIYSDGQVRSIELDGNDPMMLDGNRLILYSGTYGTPGSEYRTEAETYNRILAYGSGNQIEYFEVQTKDGKVLSYGNTQNSQLIPNGSTNKPIAWMLTHVEDALGYSIDYEYLLNQNYPYIKSINYTRHSQYIPTAYNRIDFLYENNLGGFANLVAGNSFTKKLLIRKLKIFSSNTFLSEYDFVYNFSEVHPRLVEINFSNAQGEKINPTVINWTTPPNVSDEQYVGLYQEYLDYGDFDGDGRMDVYTLRKATSSNPYNQYDTYSFYHTQTNASTKNTEMVYAGDALIGQIAFEIPTETNFGKVKYQSYNTGARTPTVGFDYNGDGKTDFLRLDIDQINNNYIYRLAFNQGSANQVSWSHHRSIYVHENHKLQVGDFDGDGKIDLLILEPHGTSCTFNLYRYQKPDIVYVSNTYRPLQEEVIDINGDEKSEFLILQDNGDAELYSYDGSTFNSKVIGHDMWDLNNMPAKVLGDFNGDGKTDFFGLEKKNGSNIGWIMLLANGVSFDIKRFAMHALGGVYSGMDPQSWLQLGAGDFNGDGITDIFKTTSWMDYYTVSSFTGESFKVKAVHVPFRFDVNYTQSYYVFGDFTDDGKSDILYYHTGEWQLLTWNKEEVEFRVSGIADGMNNFVKISYETANSSYNVTKSSAINNDILSNNAAFPIVVQVDMSNGLGLKNIQQYNYSNLYIHKQGKGLLGFLSRTIRDINNVRWSITEITNQLNTDYYFMQPSGLKKRKNVVYPVFYEQTSANTITSLGGKRYAISTITSTTNDYLTGTNSTTSQILDNNGNPSSVVQTTGDITTTTNYSDYVKAGNAWIENTAQTITTTTVKTGETPVTTTTNLNFDLTTGLLTSKTENAQLPNPVTTFNYYYPCGAAKNTKVQTTENGQTVERFSNVVEYDPTYRYVIKSTTPLGFTNSTQYNYSTGSSLEQTDIYGHVSKAKYDNCGRIVETESPQGIKTNTDYNWCTSGCPQYGLYKSTTQGDDAESITTYFDQLGRSVYTETVNFSGNTISGYTNYNALGEVIESSNMYATNNEKVISYQSSDGYGRPSSSGITGLAGATQTYNGLTTSVTSPLATTSSEIGTNGLAVSSNDGKGQIDYPAYNSLGQPKQLNVPGKTIAIEYDDYHRQKSLTDPDAGKTEYTYNSFGELATQKDANGNLTFNIIYDNLGRVKEKTEKDAVTNVETTYKYTFYDNPTDKGKGQIATVSVPGHSSSYYYDDFGRLIEETDNIGTKVYSHKYEYDKFDRVTKHTFPGGLAIANTYNNKGYLTEIRRADSGELLWQLNQVNSNGKITQRTAGNGAVTTYTYDVYGFLEDVITQKGTNVISHWDYNWDKPKGRLTGRSNLKYTNTNLSETFSYNKDRLENVYNSSGNVTVGVSYDGAGASQIISKTDVGSYDYQNGNVPPNAVKKITPSSGSIVPTITQQITYNEFNKVSNVKEGNYELQFAYGHHKQRINSKFYENGVLQVEKTYLGDVELETRSGGITREVFYISAPDGLAAIIIKQGGAYNNYYPCTDHLGSITEISEQSSNKVIEMSFDAWGRRRDPKTWAYLPDANKPWTGLIDRGYTGHEHIDAFGLINMNGRMYDPALGLMLSPDNYVSDATSTTAYNRYLYANGNPLKYTDPSGNIALIDDAIVAVTGFAIGYLSHGFSTGDWSSNAAWKAGGIGAAVGLLSYYTAGGFALAAGGSIGTGATFAGNMALNAGINAFVPQTNINLGEGYSLNVSPTLAFGGAMGGGMSATFSKQSGNFNFSVGVGMMGYSKATGTGSPGAEFRYSNQVSWDDGTTGFSFSNNNFMGSGTSQMTGAMGFRYKDFGFRYENDGFPFTGLLGDGGDRYRTAAAQVSWGDFSLNMNLFTGNFRTATDKGNTYESRRNGKCKYQYDYYVGGNVDKYRLGSLALGYKGAQIGINSERVRHGFQNVFAHDICRPQPAFLMLNRDVNSYMQYRSPNKFSLW